MQALQTLSQREFEMMQCFWEADEPLKMKELQTRWAHGETPQAQLQVLGGVGRVAHGKAADRHRDIALFGGVHHHPDELFHGFAGRAVVVLRRSQLPVHRVGILGQVVGADDEAAAAMGH